jgi:hypothetical protein
MLRRLCALFACSLLLLSTRSTRAFGQEAVTITGRVFGGGAPLRGATVRIEEIDLGTTTDASGRYSFIVPSSRVRGQTVTLTARALRFRPSSAQVRLVGGSLVQNFTLRSTAEPEPAPAPPEPARVADTVPVRQQPSREPSTAVVRPARLPVAPIERILLQPAWTTSVDSSAFTDVAGPTDLPGALAGRLPGLDVQSSSALGGSSVMLVRGPHSITGLTSPLVVVNGIPLDDANLTTVSQLSGQGGFDYGSTISDLNLEDIASVQLLRGPLAAMRWGGRAANGVLLVTTRNARGLGGTEVTASQQLTFESTLRTPSYQDAYGQGLGGLFSFFNGRGGGVNDSVSQSWGPALVGQPLPQASFTEAARAEVRPWLPHPNNVSDYFDRGRTLATNVAVGGAGESSQFRLSLSNRSMRGLTPSSSLTRRSATLTAGSRPSDRLDLSGDLQFYSDGADDRPGSGFDESNPVSVFSVMGRQVDVQTLRDHLRDALGNQISWHYAGHNNPYFAPLENQNNDSRTRWVGGGAASYGLTSWLQGTARVGVDHYTEARHFTVATGWMGGFPDFAGRGDFSSGGFQDEDITATRTNADLLLRIAPQTVGEASFAATIGAGRRSSSLSTNATASDNPANAAARISSDWSGDSHTIHVLGGVEAALRDYATLAVAARQESSSLLGGSTSQLYPSVFATIDLARANPSMRTSGLDALALRGGWARSGNEATPALLQRLGITAATPTTVLAQLVAPELTTGWEAGVDVRTLENRLGLDLSYYNDRSENLILPVAAPDFARTGAVSNKGFEARVDVVPLRAASFEWRVGASYAKNTNVVESVSGAATGVPLGLPFRGVSIEARPGFALGAIVGLGYLRDGSGNLLLRNGRPLADTVAGPRVLGVGMPDWIAGVQSGIRVGGLDLSVLFDIHRGGKIFSSTNMAGDYAGVLAETGFRPDTGLLIAGIDAATGVANTTHVSTEDYYHALGAIGERWVYDASFVKLREARVSFSLPFAFQNESLRASIVGRNLALWSNAPNIDPETVLSAATFRGAEMGQLPSVRSVGLQLSLTH